MQGKVSYYCMDPINGREHAGLCAPIPPCGVHCVLSNAVPAFVRQIRTAVSRMEIAWQGLLLSSGCSVAKKVLSHLSIVLYSVAVLGPLYVV